MSRRSWIPVCRSPLQLPGPPALGVPRLPALPMACLLACLLSGACGCSDEGDAAAGEALQRARDSFYAAIEAGDVEARIALFTEDALMLPNHGRTLSGKEQIATMLRAGGDYIFRLRNLSTIDLQLEGDLACAINEYEYAWFARGDEPQWHRTKNVHVWRRERDGGWRLHADLWNSSEPWTP